jgi:hypothetical protein
MFWKRYRKMVGEKHYNGVGNGVIGVWRYRSIIMKIMTIFNLSGLEFEDKVQEVVLNQTPVG